MLHGGLKKAIMDITPVEFALKSGEKIMIKIQSVEILKPVVNESISPAPKISEQYPKECRMRNATYKGKLMVQVGWCINNRPQMPFERCLGEIPIMVTINNSFAQYVEVKLFSQCRLVLTAVI